MTLNTKSWIEITANALLWLCFVLILSSGTENGIGYFQQPQHDLLLPLLAGALINGAVFVIHAFVLMPRYLRQRRFRRYLLSLSGLIIGAVLAKTLADKLLIVASMPDLADVPFRSLALENVWSVLLMIVFSSVYRFGRDWLTAESSSEIPGSGDHEPKVSDIWVKTGTQSERIAVADIQRIESADKYVGFVLADKQVLSLMTMNEVLECLPPGQFIRIHRSHIVSMAAIRSFTRSKIELPDKTLPIGRTYRKSVGERLAGFNSDPANSE